MIFWVFVILTVFFGFVIYDNDEFASRIIAVVPGIVSVVMLVFILNAQILADGYRASNEQRYEALIYKAQTESIRDDFGIVNKEYIDEVQSWNEDIAKYQSRSNSFWIGIFYPKRVFDGFETIDLEDIKISD